MERTAASQKIMLLGVDGMDPRLTCKYVAEGIMPNTKKLMEKGACREDLVLLGANPTVTPPMWTTLATGAYPMTHGITGFFKHSDNDLDVMHYNLDSRLCKAEQLWNVFAEAGKKTLVWHWPGSAWPPTSDSENLFVIDGTNPGGVCQGTGEVESEFILGANVKFEQPRYLKNVPDDYVAPCVVKGLDVEDENAGFDHSVLTSENIRILLMNPGEGQSSELEATYNIVQSPIKDAQGWAKEVPNAKEFTMLLSGGLLRRPCQIWCDENGIYNQVAVFRSKKETEPMAVLTRDAVGDRILDKAILDNDEQLDVVRNMRVLKLAEDGSEMKMWISAAVRIDDDSVFHPKRLHKVLSDNVGYPMPTTQIGSHEYDLLKECTIDNWYLTADWTSDSIHYLIENEGVEVVFSHFHNVDLIMHKFVRDLDKGEFYHDMTREVYKQTDYYVGKYMDLLDDGWTIILTSDHAQVCPANGTIKLGDLLGVNVRIMQELGLTVLKTDENGNELREIDWKKTKAVAIRENDIYINTKGRWKTGCVEPEDQYEVEEEVMTALYGYKHPVTGKRVVSMAIRNRDAAVLGLGGPDCGDIIYFTAEGYNYDHADGLSTTYGMHDTSLSPIFIGAGPGFKVGARTNMMIRQVDVAPTMAVIGGVRMPAQCEGAPMYSLLEKEY